MKTIKVLTTKITFDPEVFEEDRLNVLLKDITYRNISEYFTDDIQRGVMKVEKMYGEEGKNA